MLDDETWLCKSEFDRQRLVESTIKGRPIRRALMIALQLVSLAMVPVIGWPPFIAISVGNLIAEVSEFRVESARRPENQIFLGWVAMLINVALLVGLYHAHSLALMPALIAMIMPLIGGYPVRVLAIGSGMVVLTELVVGLVLIQPFDTEVLLSTVVTVAATTVLAVGVVTLIRSDETYRHESVIDPLTGMLNRRSLESHAEELLAKARFRSLSVAILMLDLDHFKSINDNHGHDVGDQVLARTSEAMQAQLRSSDVIFRIGGEEFLAILLGVDQHMVQRLADGVRLAVARSGAQPGVTISVGAAIDDASSNPDFRSLFRRADRALAEAKQSGRNCVRLSAGPTDGSGPAAVRIA